MTYAFDIDGTILHHESKPDYLSDDSLAEAKPDLEACRRVRALIMTGNRVHFITGRSHKVRAITLFQLKKYIHEDIHDGQLTTQESFLGYEKMASYKSQALQACGAVGYIGDHEADRLAAREAGVPFLFAHEFRQGVVLV